MMAPGSLFSATMFPLRRRLYSAPLQAHVLATFAGCFLSVVAFLGITEAVGFIDHESWWMVAVIAGFSALGAAFGNSIAEKRTRRQFRSAEDRAEYMTAIDIGALPSVGAPRHWLQRMHDEVRASSGALVLLGIFALFAITIILVSSIRSDDGLSGVAFSLALVVIIVAGAAFSARRVFKIRRLLRVIEHG